MMEDFLRQYRGEEVLFYPNPGNAGDSMIATASYQAFLQAGMRVTVIGIDDPTDGAIVFVGGGGNLVPLYGAVATAIRRFSGRARQLVLLPHTIRGNRDLLAAQGPSTVIFCRDPASYDHVRACNSRSTVLLGHDMAFHLDLRALRRHPRLAAAAGRCFDEFLRRRNWTRDALAGMAEAWFCRTDLESAGASGRNDADISREFQFGVGPRESQLATWCFLEAISLPQSIITDRLHVGIGAALLGKPGRLRDNSYGKNRAVFGHSIKGHFPTVDFVG